MDYKSKKKLNLQRHSDFIFFIKFFLQKKWPMSGKPHEYWICLMNYYLVGSKLCILTFLFFGATLVLG